jgi:hypothetical protein
MKKGVEIKQHSVLAGALILRLILTIRETCPLDEQDEVPARARESGAAPVVDRVACHHIPKRNTGSMRPSKSSPLVFCQFIPFLFWLTMSNLREGP